MSIFAVWLVLLLLGMPVFISLGLISLLYLLAHKMPLYVVAQRMFGALDSFILLAVPFYIMAGEVMNTGGITRRIFRFVESLLGYVPGSLGHANVIASMIFSGMSGSAVADIGGLGKVEIEAMTKAGYDLKFSAGVTAASAVIGPIIPPSIPLILYSALTGSSVGALFAGGFLPGICIGIALMITVWILSVRRGYPIRKWAGLASIREMIQSFIVAAPALLTPAIILGGIFSGLFTPTEGSVVASAYALVVSLFVYRDLKFTDIPSVVLTTLKTTCVVFLIFCTASLFSWILSIERIPQAIAQSFLAISSNPLVVLFLINAFLLLVGCFVEQLSAMIILIPFFQPIVQSLGIDLVHFGLVVTLNLMIGIMTPPFGTGLFMLQEVGRMTFEEATEACLVWILPLLVVLLLITVFPQIVLYLPRLLGW